MNNYMPTNWTTQKKMDKFLVTNSPPKLKQEIDNLTRLITRSEIKSVIKKRKKERIETPCKEKSKTRQLHWGILQNIQGRTYTNPRIYVYMEINEAKR